MIQYKNWGRYIKKEVIFLPKNIFLCFERVYNSFRHPHWPAYDEDDAQTFYDTVKQIRESVRSSITIRGYHKNYGLSKAENAFESTGAHTNTVSMIVDRALSHIYGPDFIKTSDGYTYREIMETIRIHDLSENVTGDIQDNGAGKKRPGFEEKLFYDLFFDRYSESDKEFGKRVFKLFQDMENQYSATGCLLYCADKISAILMALEYDEVDMPPLLKPSSKNASERDKQEMAICSRHKKGSCFASEMWTLDWLKIRKLVDYDESGWFTAILIMATLQIHKTWYEWN